MPKRLAYDNLKSAVTQVGRGRDRQLNKPFMELRRCYLFETRFCNVACGNEKGDVENLAKRSDRQYLTPLPEVASLAEVNDHLLLSCQRDLKLAGSKPQGDRTREQLLEEERSCLRALEGPAYEACQRMDTRIDERSLVTVDTNSYSALMR